MSDMIRELVSNDPIATALLQDAVGQLGESKADRDMLRTVRREAGRLAEEFLNLFLAGELTPRDADAIREELRKTRVERRIPGIPEELAQIYSHLGVIRSYTTHRVELDYPQALVDPLILRAYEPATVQAVGEHLGLDVAPLTDLLGGAYKALGLSPATLSRQVAEAYQSISGPLLLKYQSLNATKVYFMGPVFYGNAGRGWSLTFSTGSGLPDPLEWNGSPWFSAEYGIPLEELNRLGVGLKNPFRALNFSAGITNPTWRSRRIYVWQQSRTAEQTQKAYALAYRYGKGEKYIRDAVNQLFTVFRTPNLKILAIEKFGEPLRAWTRVSRRDVMISGRSDTSQGRIGHALWLTPGVRLGDAALTAMQSAVGGLAGLTVFQGDHLEQAFAVLALAGTVFLFERRRRDPVRKQGLVLQELRASTNKLISVIWKSRELVGIVKHAESYERQDAMRGAVGVLSSLLDADPDILLGVFQRRTSAPGPATA